MANMTKAQLTESIYNLAINRTEWMKKFNSHEEYVEKLRKFQNLYNLKQFQGGEWFSINNTSVLLDEDGVILEAIRH